MKKITLALLAMFSMSASHAQVNLSGTSYTQDFDGIGSGLPLGWQVYDGASNTALGTPLTLNTTGSSWNQSSAGFKNYASNDNFPIFASATSTLQGTETDRALGVRQTGSVGDPGASFVFKVTNTVGLTNFMLTTKLLGLDSGSVRSVDWTVDYGIGNNPTTFTAATVTGNVTTGGNTYTNETLTVNFGAALDNINDTVCIRVSALSSSTGSNNRPSTALDDWSLTWTGSSAPVYNPQLVSSSPADDDINIVPGTDLIINFDRSVQAGTGSIVVLNTTDVIPQVIAANSANVSITGQTVTISGLNLVLGKAYSVFIDSLSFDTAGYKFLGIYDTTSLNFTMAPAPIVVTTLNEGFDTDCANNNFATGWTHQSVIGSGQNWRCSGAFTAPDYYMTMNGFAGGPMDNEDWLISPQLDFSAMANPELAWRTRWRFAGPTVEVLASNDYTGAGDPNAATWTPLPVNYPSADSNSWRTKFVNLAAQNTSPFFVAFKYVSNAVDGAAQWDVDSVAAFNSLGIPDADAPSLQLAVLGQAQHNQIHLLMNSTQSAATTFTIVDLSGRKVFEESFPIQKGENRIQLNTPNLSSGMYLIRVEQRHQKGLVKVMIQ